MRAGELTRRALLLEPVEARDADGQIVQTFAGRGVVWCHLRPLLGGETVMQARLESRAPGVVTVRATSRTRRLTSEWRVEIGARTYALREDPREVQDRSMLEFVVEARGQ